MPNISVLKSSKFLTKGDVEPPVLVTITSCTEMNVAKEGAPEEFKWVLHFAETEKPMVLNSTNGQIIAGFTGSDNTDDWTNRKIVLYHDPNVSFGGKLIGGIRARAPKNLQPAAKPGAASPKSTAAPAKEWPTEPATAEDDVAF